MKPLNDMVLVQHYSNQTVVSGDKETIEEASTIFKENGAKKVVKLDVLGAFHSGLLKESSLKLKTVLNKFDFSETNIPVYYNYLGNKSNEDIKDLLVSQLYNPVKFEQIILNMINDGVNEFYVVGVGKSIDNFIRSIAIYNRLKLKVIHIEKIQDLEAINNE